MVGVTLTLSLAAIFSTASIATAGVDDATTKNYSAFARTATQGLPAPTTAPTANPIVDDHSAHAIRERSAPVSEGQPGEDTVTPRGGYEEEPDGETWTAGQDEVEDEIPEETVELEDPLAPKTRIVRNCYRSPFFFTRRSALDKNFMRFGRSGGWAPGVAEEAEGEPSILEEVDGRPANLMRYQRDRNFIRLGRSIGGNNFIRLGRDSTTGYGMEDGKEVEVGAGEAEGSGEGEEEEEGRREMRGSLNNFMRFGRTSAGRNFIRLGRDRGDDGSAAGSGGAGERGSSETGREREVDFSRTERDKLDRNFLRFGRGSDNNFMRFGRGPNNNFMRFGRGPSNNFMRFGRGAGNNFMRFGRGPNNNFMRFGRGPNNNFMRFGRGADNNFMRFGRGSGNNFMRFGRTPASDLNRNFLRFGRRGTESEENEGEGGLSRVYRANLDRNFMRFGRSNNRNFIRLGRGPGNNFMRFGRGMEVEEEDDNGSGEQEALDQKNGESKDVETRANGLSEAFAEKVSRKTPGDASEVSSRSKRSAPEEVEESLGYPLPDSTAEETLENPYGSPSLIGTSPLSAYLFSPELLMLHSLNKDSEDGRYKRNRNSNFIRFG
ncbi:FMRF-amide neuropeptides [Hetaerina americana]|uniref:FMRF-amide neuropeptides n=1 Tax=Hetaerina americana TaxID=62018 RepID=UPI003A7F5B47